MKGAVFKKKLLNPKRFKGVGAFATSFYIYQYLPYIAAYFGTTLPILTACFAGVYGMLSFAESQIVNQIRVIEEGDHVGKLRITVGLSPFASKNIVVDIKNLKSVVQLHDDSFGKNADEGNVVLVTEYFDESTN